MLRTARCGGGSFAGDANIKPRLLDPEAINTEQVAGALRGMQMAALVLAGEIEGPDPVLSGVAGTPRLAGTLHLELMAAKPRIDPNPRCLSLPFVHDDLGFYQL